MKDEPAGTLTMYIIYIYMYTHKMDQHGETKSFQGWLWASEPCPSLRAAVRGLAQLLELLVEGQAVVGLLSWLKA